MIRRLLSAIVVTAAMALPLKAAEWHAGGSVGAWRDAGSDVTTVSVAPELGVRLAPRWEAGVALGYDYARRGHVTTHLGRVAPYARFTLYSLRPVELFMEGGADMAFGVCRYDRVGSENARAWSVELRPGVAVTLNERFRLLARIGRAGYSHGNAPAAICGRTSGWGVSFAPSTLRLALLVTF